MAFCFYAIGKRSYTLALAWLALASIGFYGWWDVRYIALLLVSIIFNYSAGWFIAQYNTYAIKKSKAKFILIMAIGINLALLSYYKYANFFVSNLNAMTDSHVALSQILLPLGISFYTFTQIAFLVDTYQGKVKEFSLVHYTLFVTYFPHLIAGPVLHHKEMMPQFAKKLVCKVNTENLAVGFSIFVIGLAKKVLIADSAAEFASPIFSAVAAGATPMLIESWIAALAYTFQLYFDFSAYSDMAIGISLMFNVRLPLNFNSPYKAASIIDFWRRWHMTLSRFLRDYLYIPLGGSRNGKFQRYLNLMITMLLGGLWHGAGWTFVIWGGLHGLYLIINHAWRSTKQQLGIVHNGRLSAVLSTLLTFITVVVAWVFFRADSWTSAMTILSGMIGANGILLPKVLQAFFSDVSAQTYGLYFLRLYPHPFIDGINMLAAIKVIIGCFVVIWALPNTYEIFEKYRPTCDDTLSVNNKSKRINSFSKRLLTWKPTAIFAWVLAIVFCLCVSELTKVSEFLYYQF